ncbi:MAG TPA: GspH/FimT family protein [Methylomirabilota bacterium]|nr:GspH/FimT family protein [Methylomirabilota bacterium]
MRNQQGMTALEVLLVLAVLALGAGAATPSLSGALGGVRVHGAAADLYGAAHLTRSYAWATGQMHALVIGADGRTFRVVEDPGGAARTVYGPAVLVDAVVAEANTTIRFSPRGFAVPAGTITVRSGGEVRRVIVSLLGRVRIASGEAPG